MRVQTEYEKGQNHSVITRFLHSTRYRKLKSIALNLWESESIKKRKIKVLDIGCGASKVYEVLNPILDMDYVGIDYKSRHMEAAVQRYGSNSNFKYINDVVQNHLHEFEACDMVVCLETLEHIPESDVVRIVENLGKARPKALLFSVPNDIGPIVFVKNFGSMLIGWKRHKEYSWLETLQASLYMQDRIPRHTTEHKGFDWRWLAQTIRQNMIIKKIHRSPVNFIPCTLSPSIIFECVSDPHDGNE